MNTLRNLLLACAFLIIACAILVGVFALSKRATSPYTINASSPAVVKQLRDLNRLETASFTIEKIIDAGTTSNNALKDFLFGDRLLLIAHGEVIAGFDLSKLTQNDVQIDGSTLRLQLPAPEILVSRLDDNQTRVYDRRTGILTHGDKDLESEARKAAESSITQAACQENILNTASDNGRKQLTALLKTLGFASVIVEIPQGTC